EDTGGFVADVEVHDLRLRLGVEYPGPLYRLGGARRGSDSSPGFFHAPPAPRTARPSSSLRPALVSAWRFLSSHSSSLSAPSSSCSMARYLSAWTLPVAGMAGSCKGGRSEPK